MQARSYILDRIAVEDRGHDTPCWVWQCHTNEKGYGRIGRDTVAYAELGERRVHRLAYRAFVGPIPDGQTLDHLCCVKSCCNPEHLEPVDPVENFQRWAEQNGMQRGGTTATPKRQYRPRQPRTHCIKGHEMTPENTRVGKTGRCCRECRRIAERKRRNGAARAKVEGGAELKARTARYAHIKEVIARPHGGSV